MKERQAFYDNLKFILMIFVVFGHFAFEYRNEKLMIAICNAIYTFHMPVFIFVSGYFSRNIKVQRWADVIQLLIPYLLLEIVHWGFTKFTHLGYGNKSLLTPTYHNWYLLSLFYWRMLIPFFNKMNKNLALALIFTLSIGAGWLPQLTDFAAAYRSLYFFPVFAFGYYAQDISQYTKVSLVVKFTALFFLLAFTFLIFYVSYFDMEKAEKLLYAYAPMYGYYGESDNMLLRIAAMISGFGCGFLFLFLVPHKTTFFTRMGTKTLYVYVFHMFIVWAIIRYGLSYSPFSSLLISGISSLLITYALSLDIVSRTFRPVLDPKHLISLIRNRK